MSDELIFDSERQELRDRKKRWLIPLLVLAGILLAVVIVSLLGQVATEELFPP